jgi:3-deoxy-D-manno-octulosonate 8-phosphate phosphatase (KDO 8-P phosphatase)
MTLLSTNKLSIDNVEAIIFDFDGVLTDNLVYINEKNEESVCCSRADGLAFDALRKLDIKLFILSTEKNPIVKLRAEKLKIQAYHGLSNKLISITKLSETHQFDLSKVMYIGNDVNDYFAMKICGYSACPADSHPKILEISKITLDTPGGKGIVRELVEEVFEIDMLDSLYN